jgi:hypothetical protein
MVLSIGLSGTGKSIAVQVLGLRGHRTVDTDLDRWSRWVTLPDGSSDWVWREQAKWRARVPSQAVPG